CHAVSADVTVGRPDPAGGEDIGAALSVVDERRPSVKTPMALLAVTDSNAIKPNSATCVFILLILRGFIYIADPTRVHVPNAAYSLAPSSPSPAINSPCEEGCCSRDYEQDATRHAALRYLLRVTADDICQRYSAPVSGILAPQRVSNVTKL